MTMFSCARSSGPAAAVAFACGLVLASPARAETASITLEEAVARTLSHNPGVEAERQGVIQAEGEKLAAEGQFDWLTFVQAQDNTQRVPILPRPALPIFPNVSRTDSTQAVVGVARQLPNGIVVRPSVGVRGEETTPSSTPASTRSEIGVTFDIPLARGFGRGATEADLRAGTLGLEASREFARQEIASRVARTASAYWRSLAAADLLRLTSDTERRAEELMGMIRRLVDGGEIESALLDEAKADFLRRKSARVDAQQEWIEARQFLGVAIGLGPEELPLAPSAAGPFPEVPPVAWRDEAHAALVRLALQSRGDLRASQLNEQVQDAFLRRARNDLLPRADLSVRAAYAGGALGRGASAWEDSLREERTGGNLSAALNLEWPVRNRTARGLHRRQEAILHEAEFQTIELRNIVASSVTVAAEALRTASEQHAIAAETSEALARVLENQRAKVANGEATITQLVQNEDRYFEARTALIQAARGYFTALTSLREVTGTLVERRASAYELALDALAGPPRLEDEAP